MGSPHQKAITFDERLKIEKYIKKGYSCGDIAKMIGRSKNGVVCEVRRGGKEHYDAKLSQKLTDNILKEKYKKMSDRNKARQTTFKFKQRIENLEMQVEILSETIKEMLKNDKKDERI